jgi:hypothetical protein
MHVLLYITIPYYGLDGGGKGGTDPKGTKTGQERLPARSQGKRERGCGQGGLVKSKAKKFGFDGMDFDME